MKNKSFRTFVGKMMSINSIKLIGMLFGFIFILLVLATFGGRGNGFGRFIIDLFNTTGFREFIYFTDPNVNETNGYLSVVALFVGTVFISGMVIGMITNFLLSIGERYKNGVMSSYPWKGHILFLGYDELMIGTLKKACEDTSSFVVIAVASGVKDVVKEINTHLSSRMAKKIEVIQCNRCDIHDLNDKARVLYAKRIIIIGNPNEENHDALNMKSLAVIANKLCAKDVTTRIMVYLKNQSTFALLQRLDMLADSLNALVNDEDQNNITQGFVNKYCECFNFYSDMALRLLSQSDGLKPDWHTDEKNLFTCPDKQVHLVIMGMTPMGLALVRELLTLAHPSGRGTRFKITMVDDNAYEEMHYFIGKTRELFKLCNYSYHNYDKTSKDFVHKPSPDFLDIEFEFIQCDAAHPKLIDNLTEWAKDDKQLLTLAVCTAKSAKNMAFTLYLPNILLSGDKSIQTWIYQEEDDIMQQLLRINNYPNIHTFSLSDHAVTDIATSKVFENARELAKRFEKKYNNTDAKWEDMPVLSKWSAVHNVLSMEIKLRAIGIKAITDTIDIGNEESKILIDIIEHNRWVVEKLTNGFICTTKEQHEEITRELDELKKEYPNWDTDKSFQKDIESKRFKFKALKNMQIHDDIRSFDDIDVYTQRKDRMFLDDYIESFKS